MTKSVKVTRQNECEKISPKEFHLIAKKPFVILSSVNKLKRDTFLFVLASGWIYSDDNAYYVICRSC